MTKSKRSSEILADEKDIVLGKNRMEKCHLGNFSWQSKKFPEIGGKHFIVSGGWAQGNRIMSSLYRDVPDISLFGITRTR